jgi:hypothetical protein
MANLLSESDRQRILNDIKKKGVEFAFSDDRQCATVNDLEFQHLRDKMLNSLDELMEYTTDA